MSLELTDAFKDGRTKYLVNDKAKSKSMLFNPSPQALAEELEHSREVTPGEWDAFVTNGMLASRKEKERDQRKQ